MRVEGGFHRLDPDAVFERPQLLQGLGPLHRGGRERGEPQQAVAAVDVEADVSPRRRGGAAVARERDRGARKIHREAVAIDDHFRDVRVAAARPRRRSGAGACSSSSAASVANGATASSIIAGSISGSSPCTLTIRSQCSVRRDLRDAVGAALMRRRGHPRIAAERQDGAMDALVVGRHDHRGDRPCGSGAPVDVFDHRAAGNLGEGFAREPGRLISRGDDGDCGNCE